jgi:aminopeptidase N
VKRLLRSLLGLACALPLAVICASAATTPLRDPHSHANPDEVRVEHLALDLTVDFDRKQLRGTVTLRLHREQPNVAALSLDTHTLTIRRITLQPGGVDAQYELGSSDPTLGEKLTIALRPHTTEVVIDYATSPDAKALQWLEPAMTAGKQHPFLLSQSQAILARTWVPLQDTPTVRFTYEATLHVPRDLLAVMSAENPQHKSVDGVYRFNMPQPIPSYLLAVAVGDLAFEAFDERSGVYAEPSVLAAAAREFDDTPRMISAAEELYGPYRWGRYDLLVLPPSFPYGGMENPRLTFLTPTVIAGDKSLVELIAHELAHSWSGNLVTNATWNDFWLNEGFTTYFQHRITERLYGRAYSEMLWTRDLHEVREALAALPPADQQLYLELERRDPDEASSTVYEKGALFLRLLEESAGRETWDAFLRDYFDAHAFQPMTTQRFIAELNRALPDLAKRVDLDAWIFGPGLPKNCPTPKSPAFDKVAAAAERFGAGAPASEIAATGWSSHEWLHFVRSLPKLTPAQMAELDARFHLSTTGNNEVLSAWLIKSIDDNYRDAHSAIERFLTSIGRRKFLKPIYEALAKTPDDLALAKRIYAQARPTYHPVSQGTLDAILKHTTE